METKIAILMPTYADIPPLVYQSHMAATLKAAQHGYWTEQIGVTQKELICHGRNHLIESFLDTRCTHALCLDADVVLPNDAIIDLIEANVDVISGILFQDKPNCLPLILASGAASNKNAQSFILDWPRDKIFPIDGAGLGVCLFKREVFEKIKAPWFEFTEKSGEDLAFFKRVRKEKIPIFCHPRVMCGHEKRHLIIYEDFLEANIKPTKQIEINHENEDK